MESCAKNTKISIKYTAAYFLNYTYYVICYIYWPATKLICSVQPEKTPSFSKLHITLHDILRSDVI